MAREFFGKTLGLPGAEQPDIIPDEVTMAMLTQKQSQAVIGDREIAEAIDILTQYKAGKANLETRIVEDELWYEGRHWEAIGKRADGSPQPSSEWLFNAILNKHADAMDNFPEPIVLPRERSDEESAKTLSSILPVVLESNDFSKTYSDAWWEKLKHGTAVYGTFWNPEKENGLGDIDIRQIDLLKIFWEPGITDIQQSRNLFIVELVDEDLLDQQYPEHKGKMHGNVIEVKDYVYDDTIDTSKKVVVVDWYYKTKSPSGRTLLHYAKFVGKELLYASENDPEYRSEGWYSHGEYPVIFDTLYPEKGTPVGFGYVAICKEPQLYIDALSANIIENSMMATKKRFFVSESTNINEDEFLDWTKPLVHCAGEISDARLKEIQVDPLPGIYYNVLQSKIEEMKDTASNRDVNSGGVASGITAAAAISALQEAGNKASRDMISASYRAFESMSKLCIELMRQFYDETRSFRITAPNEGGYDFVDFNNSGIQMQDMGMVGGTMLYRMPVFDLKVKAQKTNPFSRMEQNERAKELYGMGFFNPERAQEAMLALEMMEFEGVDKVREQISQGATLYNICQQLQQQVAMLTGQVMDPNTGTPAPAQVVQGGMPSPQGSLHGAVMEAQSARTPYADRLAKRSTPNMSD